MSQSTRDLFFDPKIEHSLRQLKRGQRATEGSLEATMTMKNDQNDRTIKDYLAPTLQGCSSSIVRPPVQTNNF